MALNLKNLHILIVEDTLPMQRLLASVIESLGFPNPYVANNGIQGYEMFEKHNPDIVLTDWLMTPGDGLELTKRIRTFINSPNKLVPIILITGYSSLHRVQEARDIGVTEFLVKPFTAADIAKRISHVINNPRDFVAMEGYFGPDRRRRKADDYEGPKRRATDKAEPLKVKKDNWNIAIE